LTPHALPLTHLKRTPQIRNSQLHAASINGESFQKTAVVVWNGLPI